MSKIKSLPDVKNLKHISRKHGLRGGNAKVDLYLKFNISKIMQFMFMLLFFKA